MSLKKFSQFVDNNKKIESVSEKTEIDSINHNLSNEINKSDKVSYKYTIHENVIVFVDDFKPSESFKILNEREDIKSKYVITKQPKNTISIFKLNPKEGVKLLEFCSALMEHYKKSFNHNIKLSGSSEVLLINNIENGKLLEKIKTDLINLLKDK
jgi:hypothetical protein